MKQTFLSNCIILYLLTALTVMTSSCSDGKQAEAASTIEQIDSLTMQDAFRILNSADLTWNDILALEKRELHGTDQEERTLHSRMTALKHLYLEEFLTDGHSLKGLKGILMLHGSYFSEEQQEVLQWFNQQPDYVQKNWERCVSVHSFTEFKKAIQNISDTKK